jgi:hypothetical protein
LSAASGLISRDGQQDRETVARLSRGTSDAPSSVPDVAQRTGIEVRHRKACAARRGVRCNCDPTYQASVWSARESKRIRKTFATLA